MNEEKSMRLSQVARKLNVGTDTIVDFLRKSGFSVDNKPNAKITVEQFNLLSVEFIAAGMDKQAAVHVTIGKNYIGGGAFGNHDWTKETQEKEGMPIKETKDKYGKLSPKYKKAEDKNITHYQVDVPILPGITAVGRIQPKEDNVHDMAIPIDATEAGATTSTSTAVSPNIDSTAKLQAVERTESKDHKINLLNRDPLKQPTVVGKMVLAGRVAKKKSSDHKRQNNVVESSKKAPLNSNIDFSRKPKERKGLIVKGKSTDAGQVVDDQIKKTLVQLSKTKGDGARAKYKKDKRAALLEAEDRRQRQEEEEAKLLKVTEFISANELASLMGVGISEVLTTCISLGMVVSINQRLDAALITLLADEFGYNVQFVDAQYKTEEYIDGEGQEEIVGEWMERPPIVTIMGHVDHGKTSLLDYIRATKMTEKEIGGITQHIAAYDIVMDNDKHIVFLDTPGHEAFTAMRTRGTTITDIVVIIVAADDSVMIQTKESIGHAQVAGCPIIIAINKIDKPQANPEKVKEDLANMNILVEDWGGKYQCQEISAKTGQGVNELLEKILLEASLLELKAMPAKKASGTIIESFLDPGRGYIATAIVQDGTLRVGDVVLAGVYYGKVRAMLNHQGIVCTMASPAIPVQLLGLNGAPRAGDTFRVMSNIKEASELAQKRWQLLREQTLRTKSQLTLDEIGRRLAVGNFRELNLIIKGDVDGSIEALADALLKLSHEEVAVNILSKGVGAVSESDVRLAATTDAMIISFHIKPSAQAKKLAEKEGVIIKQHAIIYSAIDDIRLTVTKLLVPTVEEIITGKAEVKKIFIIPKIGNIAGCQMQAGIIKQANPIHLLRKGEVIFTGIISTMKHGIEELKQVKSGSECGIHIKDFNAIEVGDIIEGFEQKEIQRQVIPV